MQLIGFPNILIKNLGFTTQNKEHKKTAVNLRFFYAL